MFIPFSFFENILDHNGPLHIEDPRLQDELINMPITSQCVIAECGGLDKFLLQSKKFAAIDSVVCLLKHAGKAQFEKQRFLQYHSDLSEYLDDYPDYYDMYPTSGN